MMTDKSKIVVTAFVSFILGVLLTISIRYPLEIEKISSIHEMCTRNESEVYMIRVDVAGNIRAVKCYGSTKWIEL